MCPCFSKFQFNPPAPLVMSLLLMETVRWRGGWRCAEVECGELFMTTVDVTLMLLRSHVDNWDILQSVSYSLNIYQLDYTLSVLKLLVRFFLIYTSEILAQATCTIIYSSETLPIHSFLHRCACMSFDVTGN